MKLRVIGNIWFSGHFYILDFKPALFSQSIQDFKKIFLYILNNQLSKIFILIS